MVYQVSANRPTNGTTHTPPAFCALMGGALAGVGGQVPAPNTFGFPFLGGGVGVMSLGTHATHLFPAGSPPGVVRAIGLITCASVIYYSNTGAVYVHHANAGDVSLADFGAAIGVGGLNTAAGNIHIVYAHPNASDAGYQQTLGDFVLWGVPTNNVLEITDLQLGQFGINNFGWLGY